LHLRLQLAVHILDFDPTLHETIVGFDPQSIAPVFGNDQVESALDGFSFRLSPQHPLGTADFDRIQLEMFVSTIPRPGHAIFSP
jgi:hypothetical protein